MVVIVLGLAVLGGMLLWVIVGEEKANDARKIKKEKK